MNGIGIASVIQKITISTVTASTRCAITGVSVTAAKLAGVGMKPMISIARIPTIKPILRTGYLPIESPPQSYISRVSPAEFDKI